MQGGKCSEQWHCSGGRNPCLFFCPSQSCQQLIATGGDPPEGGAENAFGGGQGVCGKALSPLVSEHSMLQLQAEGGQDGPSTQCLLFSFPPEGIMSRQEESSAGAARGAEGGAPVLASVVPAATSSSSCSGCPGGVVAGRCCSGRVVSQTVHRMKMKATKIFPPSSVHWQCEVGWLLAFWNLPKYHHLRLAP